MAKAQMNNMAETGNVNNIVGTVASRPLCILNVKSSADSKQLRMSVAFQDVNVYEIRAKITSRLH